MDDTFNTRATVTSPLVDQTLTRIKEHEGVQGLIVVNQDDIPIRSTLDSSSTQIYIHSCRRMLTLARHAIRDLDPTNELTFLRMRSRKHEILIAPEDNYLLIVVQAGREQK